MFKQFDNKLFMVILSAAVLWWLSNYFVTKEQYNKDQIQTYQLLNEMRGDIKDLLKRK